MKTKRILALFLAVVTCLSLAVSASAASISDFKDVDTKAWYAEAVTAAVDNGLLYGKSRTQLDPNGLLTRAEMAAITNRSFGCYKAAGFPASFACLTENLRRILRTDSVRNDLLCLSRVFRFLHNG